MPYWSWAGCTRDLYNVENALVPQESGKPLTLEQVKEAIMKSRGTGRVTYKMLDVEPGLVRCHLRFKQHRAIVNIPYSTESYSIIYKSSQNLGYEAATQDNAAVIHRHYNTWIRDLDQSIQFNLSLAQANGE